MAETKQHDDKPAEPAVDKRAERRTARLVRHIQAFTAAHGGSADGHIAYLGQAGARISLVGADGQWGDLVADSVAQAEEAVRQSGITVHEEFDGEMAARVHTGPYEWSRMAGIQIGGPSNT
ncbi:hypothetical protein QNO07_12350 [Streptomyces sp. 549]|uniref:hypothetical protein n=1 Tax=Streptomyces sp. 549 TaxID=3049076 RepID=UPI0024C2E692|nr:hypothetical protein [Streptomyces sp. 549]MDK1474198.1 hypothetical protein [Streptomyces sp. 549]